MGAGREVSVSLDGVRDKNVMQLKKLNTVLFPVAIAFGEFAKLAYYSDICVGAIACRLEKKEGGAIRVYIMTLGCSCTIPRDWHWFKAVEFLTCAPSKTCVRYTCTCRQTTKTLSSSTRRSGLRSQIPFKTITSTLNQEIATLSPSPLLNLNPTNDEKSQLGEAIPPQIVLFNSISINLMIRLF